MDRKQLSMLELIRSKTREVMPSGVQVYLYGSRARGEAHSDSDWDRLILVNSDQIDTDMYDTLAFPLTRLGWEHGEIIIPVIYSRNEWNHPASLLFRKNVEQDAIALI